MFQYCHKSNRKIEERGKIATPNTQIHDTSLSWLGTSASIKRGGVELFQQCGISSFSVFYSNTLWNIKTVHVCSTA
jgi:hypothetical protein